MLYRDSRIMDKLTPPSRNKIVALSLLAIFLWFFTDHYCTKLNLNILWASPLFIHFAVRLNRSNRYLVYIQLLMLLAAMLLTVTAFPQQLNIAVFPIALILALRLIANLRHRAIPPTQG